MPKLFVSESIRIEKPPQRVFDCLNDFHSWPSWSPWSVADPQSKVTISEDGQSYQWEGEIVGSGKAHFSEVVPKRKLTMDLTFLKPSKSKALVIFELEEVEKETQLTWIIKSFLPWFLFWMQKKLTACIAHDYQRGLKRLKDFLEYGRVGSQIDIMGIEELNQVQIIGKR